MIVVQWGCGSPCLMMAMVDAETGDVYSLPLAMNDKSGSPSLALPWLRCATLLAAIQKSHFG